MSPSEELQLEDEGKKKFNLEKFINENRVPTALFFIGLILIGFGAFFYKKGYLSNSGKVEVLENATEPQSSTSEIVVEIAGAVENPGVYKLSNGDRIEDLLVLAGGVSSDADGVWIEKYVNKAAKLTDGQKLYIPRQDEQTDATSANFFDESSAVLGSQGSGQTKPVNINTATQSELEELWGIGPVYAQSIIEHRPYSTVEELLTRKIIKQNVYERNKDLLSVY